MQRIAIGKAFDGCNFSAVALCGEDRAAFEGLSILVNDASTALAGIAADVGTGQTQMFTQKLNQQRSCFPPLR